MVRHCFKLLLATSAIAVSAPAFAQSDPRNENAGGIGEIIVTAQKRETSIQDTPIAMRAVQGEELVKAGVTDVNGLQRLAPDINIVNDTVYTKVTVRGVGSQDHSEAADAAVTISIDGEYLNRPNALNASFFDLERIEVLRGPQGTLYGRNATAGAVNIITAKPRIGEFSGFGTVGYGNLDAFTLQGAVNVPVAEKAAFRIAGLRNKRNGIYDNAPIGRGSDTNLTALRAGFAAEPTDALKIYVAGEYVNVDQTAPVWKGIVIATNGILADPAYASGIVDVIPSTATVEQGGVPLNLVFDIGDRGKWALDNLGWERSKQYAVRGRIDYDLGSIGTISYIAGYRHTDRDAMLPLSGFAPNAFEQYGAGKLDTQSHEIRLSGGEKGGVIYQLGGFYFRERQESRQGLFLPVPNAYLNYFYRPEVLSVSKALFSQVTVPVVADKVSVTGGLRYTWDNKHADYVNFGAQFGFGSTPPQITETTRNGYRAFSPPTFKEGKLTWHLGVDYDVTPDNLLYAKVSSGYKGGGFDNTGVYAPETLIAYELGSKNQFLDRRLQVNLAAFYYDYTDLQIPVFIDTNVGSRTLNAGKARIWGIESDFVYAATDDLRLRLTVNYLNSKLTKFVGSHVGMLGAINDSDPVTPGNQPFDFSGNRPVQSPKWTLAGGFDYTFHIGEDKLTAGVFSRYKSEHFLSPFNRAADRQKGYSQTDVTLEYTNASGNFSLQAYVRNLENYRPATFSALNPVAGLSLWSYIFGAPRTYGAQATMKF